MNAFLGKLVKACPALPYMTLGIWLAWAYITYSGTAWLSDTETNGGNISVLYVISTTTFGLALVASTFSVGRVKRLLEKPSFIVGGGVVASLGCALIILIGPYYLSTVLPYEIIQTLFYLGCALSGLGTAVFGLKCGELYGGLTPRKAILYAALSHIMLAFIYFTVVGAPTWQPVNGGPSLVGIVVFVGMPLLASLAAALSFIAPGDAVRLVYRESRARFPRSFWKLIVVTLVLSVIVVALRSALVEASPVDVTLDNTRFVMLLRMLMAVVFACAAIGIDADHFNFGKIYSVIMAAVVALIAFCPIVGVMHLLWSQVITFLSCVYEFVLWCILAFIVYQKRISPVLVFGFGYGAFMLGSGVGWALGVFGFSQMIIASNDFALYLVLAVIVLACAFLLFSEKEFDNLFEPESADEPSLDDLLGEGLPAANDDEARVTKGRFSLAIDEVALYYGLSQREKDVLRCLAMGYDSSAIAKKLQVSWNTVRTHTRNVYIKLDVHSKQDVIALVDQATNRLL